MAENDRKKWDSRYLQHEGGGEPSHILAEYGALASVGKALDIACGNGRNTLFLAEKGFSVDAVDISRVATDRLKGQHPNIEVINADLDTWEIPPNRYELIVNIRFLNRRLFPFIHEGLKPGGTLIFESFLNAGIDAYCLQQNELLQVFQAFRVVYYEERKIDHSGRFDQAASFVGIKPGTGTA